MNEISPTTPEPAPDPTPDAGDALTPASEVLEPSPDSVPVPPADARPGTRHRLLITLLFLVLGLGGGTVGWLLQSRFIMVAAPLAPTGIPGATLPDREISLYGLEYAMQVLGISPKHSSFNLLDEVAGDSGAAISPNPAQEMAKMKLAEERRLREATPRSNRAAVYLLLLGLPLGAALGLAEGIRRRSIVMLIGGTLGCAFLAGAAGFLAGRLHAWVDAALGERYVMDFNVALLPPQFVAWLLLALGLVAWPLATNSNLKALQGLATAAFASALLFGLIYAPVAQLIFIDDPLENALPCHVYSFLFWYLFGSGMLSLLIGNACSHLGVPRPATAD